MRKGRITVKQTQLIVRVAWYQGPATSHDHYTPSFRQLRGGIVTSIILEKTVVSNRFAKCYEQELSAKLIQDNYK